MSIVKERWIVDGIRADHILHIWDDAWPYLQEAVNRIPGADKIYSEAYVLSSLYKKEFQLWYAWNIPEDRVTGAVTTEILDDAEHPGMRFLHIQLCGADGWNQWGDDMWTLLKDWGVSQGCTHAIICGRKGWKRLYGFVDCGSAPDGRPLYVRSLKG